MNIPDYVRVAGAEYEVSYKSSLNDGTHVLCGKVSYDENTIDLLSTLSEYSAGQTLWHEIIHAILHNAVIEQDEKLVDIIATGVYMVLEDNADRMFGKEEENHEDSNCGEPHK